MNTYPLRKHQSLTLFLLLTTGLLGIHQANAGTIINQSFTGVSGAAGLNAAGYYFYNNSASGTGWSTASAPMSSVSISGNAAYLPGSASVNTALFKSFTPVTLSNLGDSITVELDFQASINNNGRFLLGLYNIGSAITANQFGGGSPISGKSGFYLMQTLSQTNPTYVYTDGATSKSSATSSISLAAGSDHHLALTLTLGENGVTMSSRIDGTTLSSYLVTGVGGGFTVDTLYFDRINSTHFTYVDNIQLYAIPETGCLGLNLLGLGCISAATLLKRRKRAESCIS